MEGTCRRTFCFGRGSSHFVRRKTIASSSYASISGIQAPLPVQCADSLLDSPHLSCISRVPLSSWVDLLWAPARHALQGSKGRPTSAHHKPAGQLASCRWTSKGERGALKLVQLHSVYRKVHVYVRSPWIDKCVKYLRPDGA